MNPNNYLLLQSYKKLWVIPFLLERYASNCKFINVFFAPKYRLKLNPWTSEKFNSEIEPISDFCKSHSQILVALSYSSSFEDYPPKIVDYQIEGNILTEKVWKEFSNLGENPERTYSYINHSCFRETIFTISKLKELGFSKILALAYPRPIKKSIYLDTIRSLGLSVRIEWKFLTSSIPIFLLHTT